MTTKRYLSGIQPSGELHLGNYFGAMEQHLAHQDNAFYFIASYHAITSLHDPAELRARTFDVAASYLALGLDPARAVLFRQADIPEVTELTWLLLTVASVGLLERGHSYKDKQARGLESSGALLTYPVLMAADILAYDSDVVPVGQDQKQHVEMCRDIAGSFNARYGAPVFKLPDVRFSEAPYVPGIDGAKMSKSYKNTIPLFATGKALKERVMNIKTDSKGLDEPKDPDTCNVFALYKLFAAAAERDEMAARYRAGGYGYGHAKKALLEVIEARFADARARRARYDQRPSEVEDVLVEGARRARAVAQGVTERALRAAGVATARFPSTIGG